MFLGVYDKMVLYFVNVCHKRVSLVFDIDDFLEMATELFIQEVTLRQVFIQ